MQTSLQKTKQIENYLLKKGNADDRLLTEAYIQINIDLAEEVQNQKKTYDLIRAYGRRQLRNEIKKVNHKLFHASKYHSFQHKIWSIFK